MPRRTTSRSCSSSTKSAAVPRDVDRLLDRDAGVGRVHRRRVVDAVAEEADDVPGLLERQDDPLLLIGIDLRERSRCARPSPERFVVELVELRAGQHAIRRADRPPARRAARPGWLSPVMILTATPSPARSASASRRAGLGGSRNDEEALERQVALVVARVARLRRQRAGRDRQRRAGRPRSRREPFARARAGGVERAPARQPRAGREHVFDRAFRDAAGRLRRDRRPRSAACARSRRGSPRASGRRCRRCGAQHRLVDRVDQAALQAGVEHREREHVGGRPPSQSYAPSSATTPSVSVPVLSVQRTSMLPRFSMAASRFTSTPFP